MYLYHYYEKGKLPLLTLSDLSDEEAQKVRAIGKDDGTIINRDDDYMYYRRLIEKQMYSIFVEKGGKLLCTPCQGQIFNINAMR